MARGAVRSRYDVIEKVGESSFFTVYKARDKSTHQFVVFKVVREPFAGSGPFLEHLQQNVGAAIRLPHPSFVRTHYVGEEEGSHFLVADFVAGTTLEAKLAAEAPLPEREVLRLAIPIAEGLAYFHQNGLAHGDLRAQHVLLSPREGVKITDAALGDALLSANPSADFLQRAVPSMAPEVCAGATPTAQSDLYALGVLLYRMVTGRAPFQGDSPAQLARLHADTPPSPPTQLNPKVSRALEDLILQLLAKDPAQRSTSTAQLVRDLKQLAGSAHGGAPSDGPSFVLSPPPPREPINTTMGLLYALLLLGVMLIAAAGFALFVWYPTTREVQVPAIVGKSMFEARALLEPQGLILKVRSHSHHDTAPENQILFADPAPGETVKEGREIAVEVSDGPNVAEVPDLTELSLATAKKIVEERGFQVGEIARLYHDEIPVGHIVGQTPKGGTKWRRNARVDLAMSRGPEPESGGTNANLPGGEVSDRALAGENSIRSVSLEVVVPQGPNRQQVKIVVVDKRGSSTAYEAYHAPGDTIEQSVEVHGKEARVRVFVKGELASSSRVRADGTVVQD